MRKFKIAFYSIYTGLVTIAVIKAFDPVGAELIVKGYATSIIKTVEI